MTTPIEDRGCSRLNNHSVYKANTKVDFKLFRVLHLQDLNLLTLLISLFYFQVCYQYQPAK